MRIRMWAAVILVVVGVLAAGVGAAGFSNTYGLGDGTVAVSNNQANSSWVPVAVMVRFTGPCAGTVEVRRVSQDLSILLGSRTFTNVTSVVWVPEAPFFFGYRDALVIGSSATNGWVQVLWRGE